MKNFDLFLGCLGNGITVCNKAVSEHGDYKRVAHISPAGNVRLYVSPNSNPALSAKKKSLETLMFQGFSFISNGLRAF